MGKQEVTIGRIANAKQTAMRYERGITKHLVGPDVGASNVDVHINVINADSGLGPYHYHEKAENVYIVLEGRAQVVVEGESHYLEKDDIAFIPPGVRHAAGSAGEGPVTVIEIYAPAGRDFHIVSEDPSEFVSESGG